MEFEQLLELTSDDPIFETSFLLAGKVNPTSLLVQLTRWKDAGKVHQLRRGLYMIAPPYQKVKPHPFAIANRMRRASYVSCQSALAYYDLIPEYTPVTTSVTTLRPGIWKNLLGFYDFRHIQSSLFQGYRMTDLSNHQQAFVASPEKALLDLIYLTPKSDTPAYLHELRLQNLESLNLETLQRFASFFQSHKVQRAVEIIASLAVTEALEYQTV
jgi:predicted transcriptional regulator of viral defense system